AAWLRENGASRVGLAGYSFGALAAARAIARGEHAAAYAAVGFPTTIIGDDPARIGEVTRAVERGIPWLFLQGDRDQFCELERIRGWARSSVTIEVLAGAGHFFSGEMEEVVVRQVARFLADAVLQM